LRIAYAIIYIMTDAVGVKPEKRSVIMPVMEKARPTLSRKPINLPKVTSRHRTPVVEDEDFDLPPGLRDLPEVEDAYPPEVIEWLNKEAEIAERQLAAGELRPMSIAEIAARVGLQRNGR